MPLIRIPHIIDEQIQGKYSHHISRLRNAGLSTIFIFPNYSHNAVELEIEQFNTTTILFLRNVIHLCFVSNENVLLSLSKTTKTIKDKVIAEITTPNGIEQWHKLEPTPSAMAFRLINEDVVRLHNSDALVFSFLPTEDSTGFGFIVNGDFSTDPSRRHIIFDETTDIVIDNIAKTFVDLLRESVRQYSEIDKQIIASLIPFSDATLIQYKKSSFEKHLIDKIKNKAGNIFSNIKICPNWLNLKDYEVLLGNTNHCINRAYYEIVGLIPFLKFLGSKEFSLTDICNLDISHISNVGCAEILKQIVLQTIPSYLLSDPKHRKLKLFCCNNIRMSIEDISIENTLIDSFFISILKEKSITTNELRAFIRKNISDKYCQRLFPDEEQPLADKVSATDNQSHSYPNTNMSIGNINSMINQWLHIAKQKTNATPTKESRWRTSEIQAMEVLNSIGFNLRDVSKQNIGYDLEGTDPKGKSILIEVKSIRNQGDKIELTNNEIALAQELGEKYFIAIVRLLGGHLELALIADPVNNLTLQRQAVQWKWICEDYHFEPIQFQL